VSLLSAAAPSRAGAAIGKDTQQPAKWRDTLIEARVTFLYTIPLCSSPPPPPLPSQVASMCVSPIDSLPPPHGNPSSSMFGGAGSGSGLDAASPSDDEAALQRPDAREVALAALAARG
jgi:hypothetical protein